MSAVPPPLRFLAAVVGGWALMRGAMLAPGWWVETGQAAAPAPRGPAPPAADAADAPLPPALASLAEPGPSAWTPPIDRRRSAGLFRGTAMPAPPVPAGQPPVLAHSAARPALLMALPPPPFAIAGPPPRASRWSGSAWLLVREDRDGAALAPGGSLGGSQAGARLRYRLAGDAERPLALSARLYAPLRRSGGAEVAAGVDWKPFARVPLHFLAERRQALGDEGRSAFGLTVYGGHSGRLAGGLGFDSYAQAGVVGLRSRDLFVDGAARLWAPVGRLEVGAGAWGAAQPGAHRLDAGPQISYRLPVGRTNLRLTADWRFRLAGDAEPGSGPAVTLGADF